MYKKNHRTRNCGLRIILLAICIFLVLTFVYSVLNNNAPAQAPTYRSYSEAFTRGNTSDAIGYAVDNDLLCRIGFEEGNVDKLGEVENARNIYKTKDNGYTYIYYIGNKAGRSGAFDTFTARRHNIEEGRGLIVYEDENTTINIVTYYSREEYLLQLRNNDVHTSALVTFDFVPCVSPVPNISYENNYMQILQYVDQDRINELISHYNEYTIQILNEVYLLSIEEFDE